MENELELGSKIEKNEKTEERKNCLFLVGNMKPTEIKVNSVRIFGKIKDTNKDIELILDRKMFIKWKEKLK